MIAETREWVTAANEEEIKGEKLGVGGKTLQKSIRYHWTNIQWMQL